jgi:hypothetical protein
MFKGVQPIMYYLTRSLTQRLPSPAGVQLNSRPDLHGIAVLQQRCAWLRKHVLDTNKHHEACRTTAHSTAQQGVMQP